MPLCDGFEFVDAERDQTLRLADHALNMEPVHITDASPPEPECSPGDYYSNGEYWWPDPDRPDGLPYIRRDGYENPDSFKAHRQILRQMAGATVALTAGYRLTGNPDYAEAAQRWLHEFFIAPSTRINPHLSFAQAVPGLAKGRSYGIIDTRVLIEIPRLINILQDAPAVTSQTINGVREWFRQYLRWLRTHPNGQQEGRNRNNHSTCYFVQLSMYASFVGDDRCIAECRQWYRRVFLPTQMAENGSFPKELARTRPYSYSIFNLEQMVMLCHLLSTPSENLWDFQLPDGRGVHRGLDFLYPYLLDQNTWPYGEDVESVDRLPYRMPWMLLIACATDDKRWQKLWRHLSSPEDASLLAGQHTCRYASLWLEN